MACGLQNSLDFAGPSRLISLRVAARGPTAPRDTQAARLAGDHVESLNHRRAQAQGLGQSVTVSGTGIFRLSRRATAVEAAAIPNKADSDSPMEAFRSLPRPPLHNLFELGHHQQV
jgi:hypothetical protein